MSMTKFWLARLAGVFLVICAVTSSATQARSDGFGPPSREQLEMVRMWRLVETLAIDEAQATKIFPVFGRHRRVRAELAAERQQLRSALREQLRQTTEDDELLSQLARIRKVDVALVDLDANLHSQLEQLLSVRQQARWLLFEDSFRLDLRDMVRRMRSGMMIPGDDMRERMSHRRAQIE